MRAKEDPKQVGSEADGPAEEDSEAHWMRPAFKDKLDRGSLDLQNDLGSEPQRAYSNNLQTRNKAEGADL